MAQGESKHRSQQLWLAQHSGVAAPLLASERELLEAALGFASATVAVIDDAGCVVQLATTSDGQAWLGTCLAARLEAAGHESFQRRLARVLADREREVFEARAVAAGHEHRWYRIALAPLRERAALAIMTPIDRERSARIEKQRFRALLDQAEEAIFVVDPRTTRFVDVNDTACRMLRYTRAELLALGPQDIEVDFPLHTREQWANYMIEVMAVGTLPYDGMHRRKDGSTYPVETTWSIKPFEGDEYLLGVCRDVTEQRRIEEELRHAEETLRVSDRLITVGTLAAGIMHEINNPLSYVLGNVEYVRDRFEELADTLPEDVAAELGTSLREADHGAERMSRIVRDLRTFSRRDDDSVSPVAVNQVLDSSINIAMNEIRQRAQVERAYGDDLLVLANEPRLGQVFLNILINAAQAIEPGDSQSQRITVRTAREEPGGVVVEIQDTGAGMSREVMERIFDPFFTTKPIGEGTGLGLAICRNIVESLGGRIDATSEPGAGSGFRIWLPATSAQPQQQATRPRARASERGGRVLIVDDDAHAARALRRSLADHDGVIETDGQRGLERFCAEHFDVVFCELRMPDFGGMELYDAVAARCPERLGRIVLVTSGPLAPALEERIEAADIPSIAKPYDANEVRRLVDERLG